MQNIEPYDKNFLKIKKITSCSKRLLLFCLFLILSKLSARATAPSVQLVAPNGGEYLRGIYDINFYAKDEDIASIEDGELFIDIYYSSTKGGFSNLIIKDGNLFNKNLFNCNDTNFQDFTFCRYSWTTESVIDGNYFIDVNIHDSTGLNSIVSSNSGFMIDNNAPITTDNAPIGWQSNSFNVTLTCSDIKSGCNKTYYRIDSGLWQTGNIITIVKDGNHLIEYYSVDIAGNTESTKSSYAALKLSNHTFTIGVKLDGNYRNYDLYIPSFINGTRVSNVSSQMLTSGLNIDYAGFQSTSSFFGLTSTGSCYEINITNVNPNIFNLYATHFWTPGYGKEFFFVFGPCTYNSIEKNRYAFREGEFLKRINPVFCYPSESVYKVQTGLDYSKSTIDINSNLHLGPGTHTLLIENVGTSNKRVLIKITKR
ncbi:MAG: hypothetical protein N3F05_00375 [Candidatus Diapherotrites archaeon]|nr:hypothetical protein [Candidatus Diapherotrites archaeon]